MDFRIARITIELRDEETGAVETQEVRPGAPWPCLPELDQIITRDEGAGGPARGKEKPAKEPKEASEARQRKAVETKKDKAGEKGRAKAKEKAKPPKASVKSEEKVKSQKIDLSEPEARAAYGASILALLKDAPLSVGELHKLIGGDRMQVAAELTRLADEGAIVRSGRGRGTKYGLPGKVAATEALPEPAVVDLPEVKLKWRREMIRDRETYVAPWDEGGFRLVKMHTGSDALYFERGDETVLEYGCGERKVMKALARQLAEAGLPTPEQYRASGGDLSACPPARRTELGGVALTWRETVEGERQVCVAATGEGEMKMVRNEAGSFVLAFVREGDEDFDQLGCGTRSALEARALDILAQVRAEDEGPAATKPEPVEQPPPQRPQPEAVEEAEEEVSTEKDEAIMGALRDVLKSIDLD
ncbi:MAG: hypothetical protein H6711_15115 [Myxococcales bacterium]|nr:hypothetical protein [Myxococcales bacterium]